MTTTISWRCSCGAVFPTARALVEHVAECRPWEHHEPRPVAVQTWPSDRRMRILPPRE